MRRHLLPLLILTLLTACEHPEANIAASIRSWCSYQPSCDVNE